MKKNHKSYQLNKGDDDMYTAMTYPAIDVGKVLGQAKKISSKEALKEIIPVEWSEDVLEGKYKGKSIIKAKDDEGAENV